MTFSAPELGLGEVLRTARGFGYDGVELRLDAGHKHGVEVGLDPAGRRAVREKAADGGVDLCCLATSCRFADPETVPLNVSDALERIALAGDLGVPRMRVFGGAIPDGMGRAEAVEGVAQCLRLLADAAAAHGVVVCMETHDDWCDPEHVAEVLARVDHPAVAANWDVMHPVRAAGATVESAFQTLRPWIRHLHVHDGTLPEGALRPMGEGGIDHRRIIELLLEEGYGGYLSGEWIGWEPWEVHLPRELVRLKQYEAQSGEHENA